MSEYIDQVVINFVSITTLIALVVALADLFLIRRHKGTARLAELKPAVDSVLVIAGFIAFVGTCIVIIRTMTYLAGTGFAFWRWDGDTNSIILKPGAFGSYNTEMILTTFSILVTWFTCFVLFELWCLLRILYRRNVHKLTAAQ
jgi:hypothetical protein